MDKGVFGPFDAWWWRAKVWVVGNYLYVASRGDGTVSVIDTTTNTLVDTNPTLAGIQPIRVGNDARGLAVSSDGSRVYVSNYASNTVSVIDATTNKVVTTITVGRGPVGMAVTGNHLYVANRVDDTVKVIDTNTNKVVGGAIGVDRGRTGVMVSADGSLVYVTNSGQHLDTDVPSVPGTVTVIDTATNTVIDTNPGLSGVQPLTVGREPRAMAAYGNRFYVANTLDATVSLIDIAANGSPAVGHPSLTLSAPDPVDGSIHGQLHLADPNGDPVTVVEIIQGVNTGSIDGNPVEGTGEFTYTPDMAGRIRAGMGGATTEHWVFRVSDGVNAPVTVTMDVPISATDMTVSAARPGPTNAMVVEPDGTRAYIAGDSYPNVNNPGTIVVVDPTGTPIGSPITVGIRPSAVALNGNQLWVTNAGPDTDGNFEGDPGDDTVTVINTADRSVLATITVGNDPRGVAISQTSGYAYVSNWGSNTVTVIDTFDYHVVTTVNVGNHPWGVAARTGDGGYVYVANSWSNSVSVIDATTNTVISTFYGRNPGDLNGPISLATSNIAKGNESDEIISSWLFVGNVNGGILVFDTENNVQVHVPIVLPGGAHPYNLMTSADGSIVYASVPGTASPFDNKVYAIDARYENILDTDFHITGVQPLTVGPAPMAMAFNSETNQLYVLNRADGTISTVSMTRV